MIYHFIIKDFSQGDFMQFEKVELKENYTEWNLFFYKCRLQGNTLFIKKCSCQGTQYLECKKVF